MNKLLLVIIIIIAAFFRLHNITETPPGFYPDEAIYANNGAEAWETGDFKVFYPENNGREGLWPNIIGFFIVKFGHEPWVPRTIAAIFGILTVLGTYLLTKELFAQIQNSKFKINEKIALLSSFFLATSFWHILFSRIDFRAIMAPFFLVWGIYFLLLAFKKHNEPAALFEKSVSEAERAWFPSEARKSEAESQGASKRLGERDPVFSKIKPLAIAGLAGILFGLGFHTYIAYRATPLLILIILTLYWFRARESADVKLARKKILLIACLFSLFALIVAAPLGLYFWENPQDFFGRTTQVSVFNSPTPIKNLTTNILKTAGMFNFIGDGNWRHNFAGKPQLFWPVGILFIIGFILGIRQLFKFQILSPWKIFRSDTNVQNFKGVMMHHNTSNNQNIWNFGFWILFTWFIAAALPVVVSNEGLPHALRAILMAPAVFILAGFGGIWLYEWIRGVMMHHNTLGIKLLNIFVIVFLLVLIFQIYYFYFIKWGQNPNVSAAFNADYVILGRELNDLPKEMPKYVIVEAGGVDVRGIPMPAQTVMFITDTFETEKQKSKNIFYILPEQKNQIPENSRVFTIR